MYRLFFIFFYLSFPSFGQDKVWNYSAIDTSVSVDQEFILPHIRFEYDKAKLRDETKEYLDSFALFLTIHPLYKVEIGNHTDCRTSDHYSKRLDRNRAASICEYLIAKGIQKTRLIPMGYGKNKPIIPCEEIESMVSLENIEKAHQINRRSSFKLLEKMQEPLFYGYRSSRNIYSGDSITSGDSILLPYNFLDHRSFYTNKDSIKNLLRSVFDSSLYYSTTLIFHTDIRGSSEYNNYLSERYSAAYKAWFEIEFINFSVTAVPIGEKEPLFSEELIKPWSNEREIEQSLHAKNRRIILAIVDIKKTNDN
jgi:outer membrane protein OmpA-like peptidoglycan-associated protein